MTTQSLPISKTKTDYIYAGIALCLIAAAATISVFLTKPNAIVMRQPRMTIVLSLGIIIFVTAFIFIARAALPYYSRVIAYSTVIASAVALIAVGYFNDAGKDSGWFRFMVLCTTFTAGSTLLSELMIGYRRLIAKKPFRSHLVHRIIFSIICATLVSGGAYIYYENALDTGAVLSYETPANPTDEIQIPSTVPPFLDGSTGGSTPTNSELNTSSPNTSSVPPQSIQN